MAWSGTVSPGDTILAAHHNGLSDNAVRKALSFEGQTWYTQGSVVFADANGFLDEDNSNLFWDSGNARLAVGTTAPAEKLHVIGNIRASGVLVAGSTPTTLTDSAGKVLAAALNTVGISQGGTGQTSKTAAFDALAPTSATGDIIYFDGADNVRLASSTAGYALTMTAGLPAWLPVVSSFEGRTGAVVATSGDYSADEVTNAFDKAANNDIGAFYMDIQEIAEPATPATDTIRLFIDSADGLIKVKNDAGVVFNLTTASAGGSDTEVQFNNSGSLDGIAGLTSDGTNIALGATAYWDVAQRSAPSDPGAGTRRIFVDSSTGKLSVRTSAGTTVSLEESGSAAGPGGSPTQVQYNNSGVLDGDAGFVFDDTNIKVEMSRAVSGSYTGILIKNTQSNSLDSLDETAEIRFGFDSDEDVARFVVGKEGDHTTTSKANSFIAAYVNISDSATERFRVHQNGVNVSSGYLQMQEIATPATPATNAARLFVDQTDGLIKAVKDSGSVVGIESSLSGIVVTPEDYGAVGDGSTDDTTAIQNAITAVEGTGAVLWCTGTYKITDTIDVTDLNFTMDGGGQFDLHLASGSADMFNLPIGSNVALTGTNESLALNRRSYQVLDDLDVDSATGFTTGGFVILTYDDGGSFAFSQVTRIESIVSNTLQFDDPVMIPLDSTQTNTVRQLPLLEGLKVRNLTFTGTNASGATTARAFRLSGLHNCVFENLTFKDFTKGAAVFLDLCYGIRVAGVTLINSGTLSESDFYIFDTSNSFFSDINSQRSSGFGPQWKRATNCEFLNIHASGAASRCLKFGFCGWNNLLNLTGNQSVAGTGIAITEGSYANQFKNLVAHENATQEGIWFSGQQNQKNVIDGASCFGNGVNDIAINNTDDHNIVKNFRGEVITISTTARTAGNFVQRATYGTRSIDTGTVTVANTVTETQLKFERFPADTVRVRRTLRITAQGIYSTANGTDTFVLRVKHNSSLLNSMTSTAASVTNAGWSFQWIITVPTIGGSGVLSSSFPFAFINGVTKNPATGVTSSFDTTIQQDLNLTVQWSNALSGNTLSIQQWLVEYLD